MADQLPVCAARARPQRHRFGKMVDDAVVLQAMGRAQVVGLARREEVGLAARAMGGDRPAQSTLVDRREHRCGRRVVAVDAGAQANEAVVEIKPRLPRRASRRVRRSMTATP